MSKRANTIRTFLAAGMVALSLPAWAGLGRVSVLSRLGEPFRAEIALTGISSADLDGARVGLADAATFRDMNVDLTPDVSALQFSLRKTRDGAMIHIASRRAISEPYLRFVVSARLASGTEHREYTVLLDPAGYAVPGIGQITQDMPDYSDTDQASRYTRRPANAARKSAAAARSAGRGPGPHTAKGVAASAASAARDVTAQPGDSLRTLALRVKPARATLAQTMAAIFAANPSAFVNGDANALKPGSTLRIPPVAEMLALSPENAERRLNAGAEKPKIDPSSPHAAEGAPKPAGSPPAREAAPANPAHEASQPNAAEPAHAGAEASAGAAQIEALRDEVAKRDASLGAAQLQIRALERRLGSMQKQASAAAASAALAEKGAGGWRRYWPLVASGAAGFLALAGFAVLLLRRRKKDGAGKSESSAPDAPPGAPVAGPAMAGSAAAPAAGADVDPLAEAEVYLSYGRDTQAEEILRAALAKDPSRHDVRMKLLEIYHQNHDTPLFALHAREIQKAFEGQGPLWGRVVVMGKAIDPDNPLYGSAEAMPLDELEARLMTEEEVPAAAVTAAPPAAGDALDFDLDVGLAEGDTPAADAPAKDGNLLDFDFSMETPEPVSDAGEPPAVAATAAAAADEPSRDDDPFAGLYAQNETVAATEPAGEDAIPATSLENDPQAAKLDLARVYMDMGDNEGAREVLTEMLPEATSLMKTEVEALLERIGQ
ncbi:FimV/HubP family polar landmark protein [Paludibacterium paludis]|uniref:FimV N-terminal domain-containing protein n=1 Tax=Paludibacterium paludis TaxID=1225769 RepID=A0A918NYW2_9NEIS|nr:FimV/HubP family polar landmark protein [Paludibacterium paludis]GGY06797.1 hypothetical protein GCM10011289_06690 [Paludibacterium paludis]